MFIKFILASILASSVWSKSKPCPPIQAGVCPSTEELGCALSGVYKEKIPKEVVSMNYFEKLTLGDTVYTLLDTIYCAPKASCPQTFAPILTTDGNYKVTKVSCGKKNTIDIHFDMTLVQRTNSLGRPDPNLTQRKFTGNINSPNRIQLIEAGHKSHIMMRT